MKKMFILIVCIFAVQSFAQDTSTVNKNISGVGWNPPTQREDNTAISISEIGGYLIRFKKPADLVYKSVLVIGGEKTSYELELPTNDSYDISIAAYDMNGLYSNFAKLNYAAVINSPPKTINFTVKQKTIDPQTKCSVDITCKIVR